MSSFHFKKNIANKILSDDEMQYSSYIKCNDIGWVNEVII